MCEKTVVPAKKFNFGIFFKFRVLSVHPLITNCCVCRSHGSISSAFLWVVAVLLVLLCFFFLLVYHCVHFVVVFGTVGTGGCSVIGIEFVDGREPGCWAGKGLGEGAGKDQGEVAGKEQGRV